MTIEIGVRRPNLISAVKVEAGRRLQATDWMIVRASELGVAVPKDVIQKRAAIRARCNEFEAMTPIPADFTDDRWWP